MFVAKYFPIIIQQGSLFELPVEIQNADGTAKDLTGYTARMQVREQRDVSSSLLAECVISGTLDVAGVFSSIVGAVTSSGMPAGLFWYDLKLTNGSDIKRYLEGRAEVTAQVTV